MIKEDRLTKMISDLSDKVDDGFKKVNQRIDDLTDRVVALENKVK